MNAVWHCVTPAIYGRMNYAITARYMYAPPSQLYYDDMCLVTKALSRNLHGINYRQYFQTHNIIK